MKTPTVVHRVREGDCPFNDAMHNDADHGCPSCAMAELHEWWRLHTDGECIRKTGSPLDCPYCNTPEEEGYCEVCHGPCRGH